MGQRLTALEDGRVGALDAASWRQWLFAYLSICWPAGGPFRALSVLSLPDWGPGGEAVLREFGVGKTARSRRFWVKGDAFLRKIHSHFGFGAHRARIPASIFGFSSWPNCGPGSAMTLQEPQLFFNNLNKEKLVVYFRIPGYGAGKVDDVAAQAESSPPGRTSAAREREAKGRLGR
jgi:hypothetical protein